jgi:hypothetical protein
MIHLNIFYWLDTLCYRHILVVGGSSFFLIYMYLDVFYCVGSLISIPTYTLKKSIYIVLEKDQNILYFETEEVQINHSCA